MSIFPWVATFFLITAQQASAADSFITLDCEYTRQSGRNSHPGKFVLTIDLTNKTLFRWSWTEVDPIRGTTDRWY